MSGFMHTFGIVLIGAGIGWFFRSPTTDTWRAPTAASIVLLGIAALVVDWAIAV